MAGGKTAGRGNHYLFDFLRVPTYPLLTGPREGAKDTHTIIEAKYALFAIL